MDTDIRARLTAFGHTRPIRFCSRDDAHTLSRLLTRAKNAYFARDRVLRMLGHDRSVAARMRWGRGRWFKGLFAVDALTYDLGAAAPIVAPVRAGLGDDVVLWGGILVNQRPGDAHAWHVDVEQCRWGGVNVWLALKNVTPQSALRLIPGSHAYGRALLDLIARDAVDARDDEAVLAAARGFDPQARIEVIAPDPGQFVVFDGLAWHSSHNATSTKRSSLLLQYCRSDHVITTPTPCAQGWRWDGALAPCALVSGDDLSGANHVTPRPFGPRRVILTAPNAGPNAGPSATAARPTRGRLPQPAHAGSLG